LYPAATRSGYVKERYYDRLHAHCMLEYLVNR
jgi:hypothetical protein